MSKPLKILFITTEMEPFCKAGGLGDVSQSLPKALVKMGHDVKVIMPLHGVIDEEKHKIKLIEKDLKVRIDQDNKINFRVKRGCLTENLPIYFIDKYRYFRSRGKIYGYDDGSQRFMFFCFAALKTIEKIDSLQPDIIHCNDWQTGLIPYLLKTKFNNKNKFRKIKTLFTIHNLTFQMQKDWWTVKKKEWDDGMSDLPGFSDKHKIDRINFTKRGILSAEMINTVSEQYAREITQQKFGQGLHDILLEKDEEKRFYGIINGIDYKEYNPKTDPGLKANYDYNSLNKKNLNKKYLQKRFGFEIDEDIPLIAMATRITEQKGFDLIIEIIDALLRLKIQLILVGSADLYYKRIFKKLSEKNPKKVAARLKFETKNITSIYAGSDMFLMPSRFEPCGLGQMISLRYGSIPIVRETGGLSDTIKNYNPRTGQGNGFVFKTYDPKDLLVAIVRALENYKYKDAWLKLVGNGMQESFSWTAPAKKYVILYRKILKLKQERKPMYKTIIEIKNKMNDLAESEGFRITKPVEHFVKKEKRFYAHSVIEKKSGKKVFLKARITASESSICGLEKEMEITKIMTNSKKISAKVNFTEYLDGSLKNTPEWYTHNYVEGNLLGSFYDLPRKNQEEIYIRNIVKNLRGLQSVSEEFIKEAEKNGVIKYIKKRDYWDYKATIDFYKKEKTGNGKVDFKNIYQLVKKNEELLNKNLVIAHGDFTMANQIIEDGSGEIYLSDWESVRIDNLAADIAHLWVQSWRYKKWQAKLLREFVDSLFKKEKEDFYNIFRIIAIEQSLAEIKWNSALCERKYKRGVVDVSVKTIEKSLGGFEGLLS